MAQNAAQYPTALSGKEWNTGQDKDYENAVFPLVAAKCGSVQDLQMETKGIEPSFPRCDRGVLPLHHVPGNILLRYFTISLL